MSAWESIEALWEFVYSGRHLEVMRRRREWMTRIAQSFLALWWVRAGTLPTIDDIAAALAPLGDRAVISDIAIGRADTAQTMPDPFPADVLVRIDPADIDVRTYEAAVAA